MENNLKTWKQAEFHWNRTVVPDKRVFWGWCTGTTQRDGTGREEGSGWGTRVYLWRIHVDIWQNQYNVVKLKKQTNKQKSCLFKKKNYQIVILDYMPSLLFFAYSNIIFPPKLGSANPWLNTWLDHLADTCTVPSVHIGLVSPAPSQLLKSKDQMLYLLSMPRAILCSCY